LPAINEPSLSPDFAPTFSNALAQRNLGSNFLFQSFINIKYYWANSYILNDIYQAGNKIIFMQMGIGSAIIWAVFILGTHIIIQKWVGFLIEGESFIVFFFS